MTRWYAGFRCVGNPKVVLDQISRKIRNDNLGKFVPRVCFEKRPRHQFYLFMAIESAVPGKPPPELQGLLALSWLCSPVHPHRCQYGYHAFTREEIRGLVGAEVNVQDYARRIRYHRLATLPLEDPFGVFPDAHEHGDEQGMVKRTELYNCLLHCLSAVGSGSLASFQTACHTLDLSQDNVDTRRILRRLRLLGHLECSRDGTRWSIASPVLTRRCHPTGDDTYVFCGGRDTALLEALRLQGLVEEVPQPVGEGPATVYICGVDPAQPIAVTGLDSAFWLQVIDNAAERLANLLPPIEVWPDTLQVLPGITPYMFDVRRFDGSGFVDEVFEGKSGFYELWPPAGGGQPPRAPKYTLFYDAKQDRWLRGDWYGLRYLALWLEGESCEVRYDQGAGHLALPQDWRWPELYERVLVLASGRLPVHREGWLIYEAISSHLLDVLRTKLHLQP